MMFSTTVKLIQLMTNPSYLYKMAISIDAYNLVTCV